MKKYALKAMIIGLLCFFQMRSSEDVNRLISRPMAERDAVFAQYKGKNIATVENFFDKYAKARMNQLARDIKRAGLTAIFIKDSSNVTPEFRAFEPKVEGAITHLFNVMRKIGLIDLMPSYRKQLIYNVLTGEPLASLARVNNRYGDDDLDRLVKRLIEKGYRK